jgi:hypothetical protein
VKPSLVSILLIIAATIVVAPHIHCVELERPTDYGAFHTVEQSSSLAAVISADSYIYLPPGTHVVNNPLVIDRDEPLFIHGAGQRGTRLVAKNRGRPLILVQRVPLLNLSNLQLIPASGSVSKEPRALLVAGEKPVVVEIQDCNVDESALEFRGPGSFRLQGTTLIPKGALRAPIVIDHPDALFTMVGGNISNGKRAARFTSPEAYHIWQKRGRLRIYGTGVQASLGRADFRIETASRHGPHLIANVRSEGNNGANRGKFRSTLVEVPPTEESVELVVQSSSGAWTSQGRGEARLVDFNAAGTLWLLGNNAFTSSRALAEGRGARARVVTFGNVTYDGNDPLPIDAAEEISIGNLRYRETWVGHPLGRVVALPSVGSPDAAKALVANLPRLELPEPLSRPRLDAPLPGMQSVREFGAVGDGKHDDTKSLQAAIDSRCGDPSGKILYFPAGRYRITDRLRFNHNEAKCKKHPSGGWLAGAGSTRTKLVREGGGPGGVFVSQGIAQATIEGLTFQATPFDRSNPGRVTEAAFALENDPKVGHATQGVSFYDVVFDGGRQALGIGLESRSNCSENLIVDGVFRNAHVGLAIGSYNALANLVYRGSFENNDIAMGHDEQTLSGGTWAVLGAKVRGTHLRDIALRNSAGGVWFIHGLDSDSKVIADQRATGAVFPLLFEYSHWKTASSVPVRFDFKAAGGVIFLRSSVAQLDLDLRSIPGSYALALDSSLGGFRSARLGENSRSWTSND